MFDIGALELLVVVIVAIVVIGPKDMPQALRAAGRWIGKLRRVSAQFRSGFDAMVREAELEDMEKKWQEQNRRIMAETPPADMTALPRDHDQSSDSERPNTEGEEPQAAETGRSADEDRQPSLPLDGEVGGKTV